MMSTLAARASAPALRFDSPNDKLRFVIARQRVAAGVAFLERHQNKLPSGWRARIDLGRLNIGSSENCVFGQLCGSYCIGLKKTGLRRDRAHLLGFSERTHDPLRPEWELAREPGLDYLNAAWREALTT